MITIRNWTDNELRVMTDMQLLTRMTFVILRFQLAIMEHQEPVLWEVRLAQRIIGELRERNMI